MPTTRRRYAPRRHSPRVASWIWILNFWIGELDSQIHVLSEGGLTSHSLSFSCLDVPRDQHPARDDFLWACPEGARLIAPYQEAYAAMLRRLEREDPPPPGPGLWPPFGELAGVARGLRKALACQRTQLCDEFDLPAA